MVIIFEQNWAGTDGPNLLHSLVRTVGYAMRSRTIAANELQQMTKEMEDTHQVSIETQDRLQRDLGVANRQLTKQASSDDGAKLRQERLDHTKEMEVAPQLSTEKQNHFQKELVTARNELQSERNNASNDAELQNSQARLIQEKMDHMKKRGAYWTKRFRRS